MNEDINIKIKSLMDKNEVCLFMKGTPEVPQCGFSSAISNFRKLKRHLSHVAHNYINRRG